MSMHSAVNCWNCFNIQVELYTLQKHVALINTVNQQNQLAKWHVESWWMQHPPACCLREMLACMNIAEEYLLLSVPGFYWELWEQLGGKRRHLERLRDSHTNSAEQSEMSTPYNVLTQIMTFLVNSNTSNGSCKTGRNWWKVFLVTVQDNGLPFPLAWGITVGVYVWCELR